MNLSNSKITDLNNLTKVKSLYLVNTPITKLPDNLTKVNGTLNLRNSKIEDLNNLTTVNGYLNLSNTPLSKNTELMEELEKKFKIII